MAQQKYTTARTYYNMTIPVDIRDDLKTRARHMSAVNAIDLDVADLVMAAICAYYGYVPPSAESSFILNHAGATQQ